jgi:hypothetical protein
MCGEKRKAGSALLVFVIACGGVGRLTAAEWKVQLVDPAAAGTFSSFRLDSHGNGHVSYLDEPHNQLKYGFWDRRLNKWFTTALDASGGFCSLAVDSSDLPHISYLDYGSGRIKYAHWDGSSWEKKTLLIRAKNISFYTSIAMDPQDRPRISYYEYWGAGDDYTLHLRIVAWNGVSWEVQTIDRTAGSGKFNFLASDSKRNPRIAYANVKAENQSLRYARWNGRSWEIDVIEGAREPFAVFSVSLALDPNDVPHIAYTDVANNLVKYAVKRDGKWQISTVGALKESAYPDRHGIAVDEAGNPYISYYDAGLGTLKLVYRKDGRWKMETVAENFAGFTSSLQISGGAVYVTFRDDSTQQLQFAFRPLQEPAEQPRDEAALGK